MVFPSHWFSGGLFKSSGFILDDRKFDSIKDYCKGRNESVETYCEQVGTANPLLEGCAIGS